MHRWALLPMLLYLNVYDVTSSKDENRLYRSFSLYRNNEKKQGSDTFLSIPVPRNVVRFEIWIDYRLAWNVSRYGGVTSIRFAGGENQIWRPDVLLYNSANEDFDSTYKSNEVVYSTGEVNWVPPGIFRASCKMDITYFPFDDQLCHLKFGSWTYNGNALDLQISTENGEVFFSEPAMDLSTYTPSGEWNLIKVPAVREVFYSQCCPEPYSTVTFYMLLRRRSIFYLFNIVFPSLLISLMTLVGFCLPAHDMSEKIGYQTTILLSICFFVTIVSEMTPPTSESVPLLGMFFSTLTLIVAVSTTFTITVLHFRYRHPYNTKMTPAEEWKFAALALDRLCLILFTFLIASFVISMIFSTPHFDA
ncbi:Neurotransmitter-gated ion-channel ligand binding domain protein [Teladorsagia circumcincta]|uniref:Neurotransmitter-gated ion-channel ligand binding domain protein n=1 Tax=Teladorsagia circumcincta TaxID=45464 RepID=A0A2G9UPA5_TELCI|nr:Neurotransmitter-gated ion-channel ligand binding domain protein [Teladorsagia circumcincta]